MDPYTYTVPQNNMTLTYLMGDQLGSTSLAVNASTGAVIETRYKAWGEVRYVTPNVTLPTRNTFTGQYSYVSDEATDLGSSGFGLMFYQSRWYDPALGRMAQADTIVPGGVQGLDRYAYVNNSPLNYVDPSGHKACWATKYNTCNDIPPCVDDGNKGYCRLSNGAIIDKSHYTDDVATKFWQDLLEAANGKTRTTITITLGAAIGTFSATYSVSVAGLDSNRLRQIGAGIWSDFQIRFEDWEGTLAFGWGAGVSQFSNEDIPTTFIAFVAASYGGAKKGWGFDDVIAKLGATQADRASTGDGDATKMCLEKNICGGGTPRNTSIYSKVDNGDGDWIIIDYPIPELNITPITDPKYYTFVSCSASPTNTVNC